MIAEAIAPLRRTVRDFTDLVSATTDEAALVSRGRELVAALVSDDGWLPDVFATTRRDRYAQHLLHCDPLERFSIVSFVWGPGQRTPVHNHTVWGLVGVLRGAECTEEFELRDELPVEAGTSHLMAAGDVDAVSPSLGDWHRVSNAAADVSVSIHVYGGNVGALRRSKWDEATRRCVPFISGYDNDVTPNLWGGPDQRGPR